MIIALCIALQFSQLCNKFVSNWSKEQTYFQITCILSPPSNATCPCTCYVQSVRSVCAVLVCLSCKDAGSLASWGTQMALEWKHAGYPLFIYPRGNGGVTQRSAPPCLDWLLSQLAYMAWALTVTSSTPFSRLLWVPGAGNTTIAVKRMHSRRQGPTRGVKMSPKLNF